MRSNDSKATLREENARRVRAMERRMDELQHAAPPSTAPSSSAGGSSASAESAELRREIEELRAQVGALRSAAVVENMGTEEPPPLYEPRRQTVRGS